MTIAPLVEKLGLEPFPQPSQSKFRIAELGVLEAAASSLVKSIRNDTLTLNQIDSFIDNHLSLVPASKKQDVLEYLLCTKAGLLFVEGKSEAGLKEYDQALGIKEVPSTWALKGTALLQLERWDEAFEAYQKAHSLREDFGPQEQDYLTDLFATWSTAALLLGLSGILEEDLPEAQKGVREYLAVQDKATSEGLEASLGKLAAQEPVSIRLEAALEELELMVRLLSIKNPFDRWRELTKEISKVWPHDVSAVDAIREQRARDWNT